MQNTVVCSSSQRIFNIQNVRLLARTHDLRVIRTTLLPTELTGQLNSHFISIIVYVFRVSFQGILTSDPEYSHPFSFWKNMRPAKF